MTLEQDGSKLAHGVFEATEEGEWYFRVCPNNFESSVWVSVDVHPIPKTATAITVTNSVSLVFMITLF